MNNDASNKIITDKRIKAIESLKVLLAILAGLAVTNCLTQWLNPNQTGASNAAFELADGKLISSIISIFLLLTVIRFFHGNIRLLDDTYLIETDSGKEGGQEDRFRKASLSFDFFATVLIAVLLAAMSFQVSNLFAFAVCYWVLIVFDVFWLFSTSKIRATFVTIFQSSRDARSVALKGHANFYIKWFVLNGISIILLPVFVAVILSLRSEQGGSTFTDENLDIAVAVMFLALVNTIADFVVSWRNYFPAYPEQTPNKQTPEESTL